MIIDRRHAGHEEVRWYLDGHSSKREREPDGRPPGPRPYHGHWVLLSLAVGGAFPDDQCRCATPTNQTSSQGTMEVRSVSVYTN